MARTEQWLLRRGIPHFIDGYSATGDVLTRALPALTIVFLFEMLGAVNLEWPLWANVLAVAGGIGFLVAGWALVNRLRGRPALSRPERVGTVEVAAFVLLPALVPLAINAQPVSAAVTAGSNLVLLAVISFTVSYGLLPMTRWAAGRLVAQLGAIIRLLGRALPLLLLFVTFLFLATEIWEVAAHLDGVFLGVVLALFILAGIGFLLLRLPAELKQLTVFDSWDDLIGLVEDTPVSTVATRVPAPEIASPPLSTRQWGNVWLVVLYSQGIQILLVSAVVGLFFVVFGLLTVPKELVERWSGTPPDILAQVTLSGNKVVLTSQLLKVAAFLSAFTGLSFTVSALTDDTYRREFFEEVVLEVREAIAVRAVYLAARAG